jgi:hypothetical protein
MVLVERIKRGRMMTMEKKGLCSTCIHDKECTFPRKFPVWQCEEFTTGETKSQTTGKVRRRKK